MGYRNIVMFNDPLTERQTRKLLIDKLLKESGWFVLPYDKFTNISAQQFQSLLTKNNCSGFAVEEYPTATGPADYILVVDGRGLAALEGKKLSIGPQNVLEQSKRYAKGFQNGSFGFGDYHLPFVYSTNGKIVWFQDLRNSLNRAREITKFHRPEALREFLTINKESAEDWLKNNPVNQPELRYYQKEAIERIEEATVNRKRNMLIAMATGTGKTFTIVNLIYRLMKSGYAKRILFLVDRRALAAQAVTTLSSFEAEPGLKFDQIYEVYSQRFKREDLEEGMKFDLKVLPAEYLTNPQSKHSFVYVCTIQRMRINLFGQEGMFESIIGDLEEDIEAERLDIPVHAFDVIIADECHRGYTAQEESKWREVLNHFDGIRIGLTATPAAHTTTFFKEIVYRYDYETAVRDGYLVDYDAIAISSDITINGVFLEAGEEVGLKDTETGQLVFDILEDERELPPPDIENWWTAPDRNQKIIQEIQKYLLEQEEKLGHFPKTLIFADNDLPHISHADQLVNILRDELNRGDDFVQKITGSPTVDRPLQKIREFRNRPNPAIVVTVDMLSTGVDVPKIENIVFLRPVKSRILFEQMMGRGTRLCPEIHKTNFTVFDCFNGTLLEYFRKTTSITAEPPEKATRTIREIVQAVANNQDRDYNIKVLSKRLLRISKNVTQEGREQFYEVLSEDIAEFGKNLPQRLEKNWQNTMSILQSEEFLTLTETYPRPSKVFILATSKVDFVTSEYIFRAKDGSELKPEDYIKVFERFVKENPEHIEALEILLKRPQVFHTEHLIEIRKKFATNPDFLVDKFTEQNLRKAYNMELADIISMIKHAAKGGPLLTIEQRVDTALAKLEANQTFTREQIKWLNLIREHLIANLLIEKEDFDEHITFVREGASWRRLDGIFNGKLQRVIYEINLGVLTV